LTEGAIERALPLLRAKERRRADTSNGFIDVLGRDLPSTGRVQDLMRLRAVGRVYERWWRPPLGRLFKGAFGPGMADEHRIARILLRLAPGDGVLDVACGPGNFSREFARAVGDVGLVVGVDASRVMLERAMLEDRNQQVDNLAFVLGNAVDLPFRKSSFDAVSCFAALHLFSNPFKALDRMRAVLGPGGRIAIFTTCHGRSLPLRSFEQAAARAGGMRMFGQDELVEALERRGFGEVRQRLAGFTQFVGGRLEG
jgi:ubiquinone/menaquinone biosynthesis C-methylase UbiE